MSKAKPKLAPAPKDVSRPANDVAPETVALYVEREQLRGASAFLANVIASLQDTLLSQKVRIAELDRLLAPHEQEPR